MKTPWWAGDGLGEAPPVIVTALLGWVLNHGLGADYDLTAGIDSEPGTIYVGN